MYHVSRQTRARTSQVERQQLLEADGDDVRPPALVREEVGDVERRCEPLDKIL
jgi:hypothetical protein